MVDLAIEIKKSSTSNSTSTKKTPIIKSLIAKVPNEVVSMSNFNKIGNYIPFQLPPLWIHSS
jgi:hypothetical protein